ncbi:hypothetical protein Hanom_Chr05g00421021 [Helianthus anomalus]
MEVSATNRLIKLKLERHITLFSVLVPEVTRELTIGASNTLQNQNKSKVSTIFN